MRLLLVMAIVIVSASAKAQTVLPLSFADYMQRQAFVRHNNFADSSSHKKWFFSKYISLATGLNFYRGTTATFVAAPVGIQLNRRLTNNLYAFAGVSAAPAYVSFNRAVFTSGANKQFSGNSFLQPNNFGLYSRAELGLMYINDAGTFSISGSIGIERNNYSMYPVYPNNNSRQNTVISHNR